jgi:oligopeptidase A
MTDNPLVARRFDIPFHEIRAEHVEPGIAAVLEEARSRLRALLEARTARTYENTLRALEDVTVDLEWAMSVVGHLEAVATTPELRAAYNAVLPAVTDFESGIVLDAELWRILRAYSESDDARRLEGVRRRFLDKTLRDFRREGADLPEEKKTRLEELNRALAQVTTQFAENVLDATASFEVVITDPARLSGLPDSAVAAARADAQARNREGWRFTLHEPSLVAVLTYADDADLREAIYLAHTTRAAQGTCDNRPLLARILELRREKAQLLGYPTFADYVLEERMAKNARTALAFLEDLAARTRPFFERENAELEAFYRELAGPAAPAMRPWDVGYYAEKMRRRLYDFDEEALRPYFPLGQVLGGMFEIVQRLYGIEVREVHPGEPGFPEIWHPDVRYFRIYDEAGTFRAAFYADFFPRDTKRGGAWMGDFLTGGPTPGGFEPNLGVICANFTPPIGDRPSLLTHREVETLFHEFGHLLHHGLSRVEVRSLAGTSVAWDFVELPSQIMENWCWEREALDLFARHVDTGETIPQALLAKKLAARNFRSANAMMRQIGYGMLDLWLHTTYDPARDGDILARARAILQEFSPVALGPDNAMVAGFTHLFADPVGYAAGYYSYKWAEVLDADAFTRFQRDGILSREVGRAFLEEILSKGDSEEPDLLFRRFLGRDPDVEALLRRSGLA